MVNRCILVAGGAGFIGSNIVDHLIDHTDTPKVIVIDNLSTGRLSNITKFKYNPRLQVVIGDITDKKTCARVCENVDAVICQAALGSVQRSMKTPTISHDNNVHGFMNLLDAARKAGVKRFIYASSSAVYGNTKDICDLDYCNPISFYGLTKHVNDLYANYYSKYFGMECIGLRYHNVFGKYQSCTGEYSAVIPIFIKSALSENDIIVHGDGSQYRDFTHVDNVVHANMLCLSTNNNVAFGKSFDIGAGGKQSVLSLAHDILKNTDSKSNIQFTARRTGDIDASYAHMTSAADLIGYTPVSSFAQGLRDTIKYYQLHEQ